MRKAWLFTGLVLALTACQNSAEDKQKHIDSLLAVTNSTTEGTVVFSHTLNGSHCYSSYSIAGRTLDGKTIQRRTLSVIRGFGKTPVLATMKLPAGNYQIIGLECIQSYTISGLGPLANFTVEPGKINDLNVLAIKNIKSKKLFGRDKLETSVRAFNSTELEQISETHPKFTGLMVSNPMTTEINVEILAETLAIKQELREKQAAEEKERRENPPDIKLPEPLPSQHAGSENPTPWTKATGPNKPKIIQRDKSLRNFNNDDTTKVQ
ncbi:MAG: hypothetical protein AAF423_08900 [Pseudomonadota bacterium]